MSIIFNSSILAPGLPLWLPSIAANLVSPALVAAARIVEERSKQGNFSLRPLAIRRNTNGPTLSMGLLNTLGLVPVNLALGDWQNCIRAGWLLRSCVRQGLLALSPLPKPQVIDNQSSRVEIAPTPKDRGLAKNMLLVKRPAHTFRPDPEVLVDIFHDLKINDAVCKAIWFHLPVSPCGLYSDVSEFPVPDIHPTIDIKLILLLIAKASSPLLLESGTGSITEIVSENGSSITDISTSSEPTLVLDALPDTQPDAKIFNDNSVIIAPTPIDNRILPARFDDSSESIVPFDSPVASPVRTLSLLATAFVLPPACDSLASASSPTEESKAETPNAPAKLTRRAKKRLLKLRLAQMASEASSSPKSDLAGSGTNTVQSTQPDAALEDTATSSGASPVRLNPLATEFIPPPACIPLFPQDSPAPEDHPAQVPQTSAKMSRGAKRRLAKRLRLQASSEAHPPLDGNLNNSNVPPVTSTAHPQSTPANFHGHSQPPTHMRGASEPIFHDPYTALVNFPFNAVSMSGYSAHSNPMHALMPHTPPLFQAPLMPPSGYQNPNSFPMISPPYDYTNCHPTVYYPGPPPAFGH